MTIAILSTSVTMAQMNKPSDVSNETQTKTYTLYKNGEKVMNKVKIETSKSQAVMLDQDDKGNVNQDRIDPPTVVVKTVKIDNDTDDQFDELIKFSYLTRTPSDFTLVSSESNIMLAVEEGENLTILEDRFISKENMDFSQRAYIYTTDDGQKLEFTVKSFENMKPEQSK
ncbi:MAG: hypothetical protein HKP38_06290 [Croceitalea sp.]|nr:hypothetical protein [Croceitalea sp.]NNL08816.1 hypothetical protein [Croceitalea sp.]NNM19183.1 hypothetical protein [Croceitalea sp.]